MGLRLRCVGQDHAVVGRPVLENKALALATGPSFVYVIWLSIGQTGVAACMVTGAAGVAAGMVMVYVAAALSHAFRARPRTPYGYRLRRA